MGVYRALRTGPVMVGGYSRDLAEGDLLEDLSDSDIETLTTHGWIEEARGEKSKAENAEAKRRADETRITGKESDAGRRAADDDKTLTTKSVGRKD